MSTRASIYGQRFELDPTGAVYWVEQDLLLIADVHLGKSAHFRKNGMAVPATADDKEYDKLTNLIHKYKASRLWFLGDLFHSYQNAEWHFFEQWMRFQTADIALIMGNHDVISKKEFNRIGLKTYEAIRMDAVFLTHHPEIKQGFFNIAGHIHPSVKLQGTGKQSMKLPCFHVCETGMILPAFGDFTGTYTIQPKKGDRVFVVADNEVIEMR